MKNQNEQTNSELNKKPGTVYEELYGNKEADENEKSLKEAGAFGSATRFAGPESGDEEASEPTTELPPKPALEEMPIKEPGGEDDNGEEDSKS